MNHIQQQMGMLNDSANRLDYENSNTNLRLPRTKQQLEQLMMQASNDGPGSDAQILLFQIYQNGWDEDLPDADGLGIPRGTSNAMADLQFDRHQDVWGEVDPLLQNTRTAEGTPLADLGPEGLQNYLAALAADSTPSQLQTIHEIQAAINRSTVNPWTGMQIIEPDEPAGQMLTWQAKSDPDAGDPSGYSQMRAAKHEYDLASLKVKQGVDPSMFGISSDGLSYDAGLAAEQAAAYYGQPDMGGNDGGDADE